MGFFEKLTKKSPEYLEALRVQKEQIRAQGDAVIAQIHKDRDAQIEADRRRFAPKIAATEASIERSKQRSIDTLKGGLLTLACTSLMSNIYMPISAASRKSSDLSDAQAFMNARQAVRGEIEKRVEALKASPSAEAITGLQQWALEQVGGDERGVQQINAAFGGFAKTLKENEISLGE